LKWFFSKVENARSAKNVDRRFSVFQLTRTTGLRFVQDLRRVHTDMSRSPVSCTRDYTGYRKHEFACIVIIIIIIIQGLSTLSHSQK